MWLKVTIMLGNERLDKKRLINMDNVELVSPQVYSLNGSEYSATLITFTSGESVKVSEPLGWFETHLDPGE